MYIKSKIFLAFCLAAPLSLLAGIEKCKTYYENGEYEKAIKEARASKDEYSNPELHLIWAKSAEALGRLDEAMSAYERVIILDDNDIDAKVTVANIYNKTNRNELAQESKKELQNYQLTPEQRSSLGLIKDEEIQAIKAQAKISFGYDNNINVSADDKKSTTFGRFNGSVSYINDLQGKKEWYLRSDLKLYYQNNSDAHKYDMFFGSVDMGVGYAGGGYNVYVPVGYGLVNYLDENLLKQFTIEPKIDILLDDLILNINAKYLTRNYRPNRYKIMDDSSYGGGLGAYYLSGKDFVYLKLKYENFSADDVQSLYVDKDLYTVVTGVNYNFADLIVSRLDYRYRKGLYDDYALLKSEKREDDYHQFELKFSHYLNEKLELFISNRYVKNKSNNISTDYTKNITMFGLSANY